ncbi:MAG: Hsp20/alpha crystallin family protein [Firmicutes bacterium]|jgi:HSP20 family protein|nr:Hsp20/alpha crystallin family protein [Bacillota bacterium]
MDLEKLLRWRELAQKFQSGGFWPGVFDTPEGRDFWSTFAQSAEAEQGFPRADVYASESEITVLVELPGLTREDIEILVLGSQIKVKGNVREPLSNGKAISRERIYGPFERVVQLPEQVREEGARARFVNGLLEIRLVKEQIAEGFNVKIE